MAALVIWPFSSFIYAVRQTRNLGPRILRKTSKSLFRQFREQMSLVFGAGLPAYAYYQYELFRDDKFQNAADLVLPFVAQAALYPVINHHPKRNMLENKEAFHDLCQAQDLPMPELVWCHGRTLGALPEVDLLSKPILGGHGEGIRKWSWQGGFWRATNGDELGAEEFIAWLDATSVENPQILERHVANANLIADLGSGVLTTVRIITCLDEGGEPIPVQAIIRMPTKSADIDNIGRLGATGGIAAPIDMESGVLGSARRVYRNSRRYAYHPANKAPIKGRELPFWPETKILACEAHKIAFPELSLIGWDIGITESGPVLIEGNWTPSLRSLQAASGFGAGGTLMGDLMAFHLARLAFDSAPVFK